MKWLPATGPAKRGFYFRHQEQNNTWTGYIHIEKSGDNAGRAKR